MQQRNLHTMKLTLLLFVFASLSVTACKADPGEVAASYSSLQQLSIGTPTTVDACYHSGRHGSSLRSCDKPGSAGFRTAFAESIRQEPDVRALSQVSGAQWAPNSRLVIRVRVSGYFERSDLDVPGGQRFLITKLHWFSTGPEPTEEL